jgi:hypothetical protein
MCGLPGSTWDRPAIKVLYQLHMEGDFGQDSRVFGTEEAAKKWAEKSYERQKVSWEDDPPFEDFWEDCAVTKLEYIP